MLELCRLQGHAFLLPKPLPISQVHHAPGAYLSLHLQPMRQILIGWGRPTHAGDNSALFLATPRPKPRTLTTNSAEVADLAENGPGTPPPPGENLPRTKKNRTKPQQKTGQQNRQKQNPRQKKNGQNLHPGQNPPDKSSPGQNPPDKTPAGQITPVQKNPRTNPSLVP